MRDDSLPLPPPTGSSKGHDEIATEIADHLAAAEAELTKRGIAADDAKSAARKKFGDVEKIQKTCYWIQNGETIMLRWTLIALASVLCVLLGLSVLGNWRTQSQLADEMGKLSAELKALAAAKQTPPPVPQPPEITGVIYAGSKDKPLAGASVAILRADATIVRRTNCDKNGVYHSGPLEPGDFAVTTPIQAAPPCYADLIAQSQPIFLHHLSGNIALDLDAAYHAGGLKISVNRKLPEARKEGSYLILSRLSLFVVRSRQRTRPWIPKEQNPTGWPIYCDPVFPERTADAFNAWGGNIDGISPSSNIFFLNPGEECEYLDQGLHEKAILPPGETEIQPTLLLSILPLDERGEVVMPIDRYRELQTRARTLPKLDTGSRENSKSKSIPSAAIEKLDGYAWSLLYGGDLWVSKLRGFRAVDRMYHAPKSLPRQNANVKDGQFTRIVVEIPDGIEDEIQKVIESTPEPEKFEKASREGLLRRPLTFRVVGFEAMTK